MTRPQVNLRVSEEQKGRWEDYIEESPEYDTLTDLIRVSVEREIAGEGRSRRTNSGGSSTDERIGELVQSVEKMTHSFQKLRPSVEDAVNAMYADGQDLEVSGVFEALPNGKRNAVTAEVIADELDENVNSTRIALERLCKNTGVVNKQTRTAKTTDNAAPQPASPVFYREE